MTIPMEEFDWFKWMEANRVILTPVLEHRPSGPVLLLWYAGRRQLRNNWQNLVVAAHNFSGADPVDALRKLKAHLDVIEVRDVWDPTVDGF